jgi:inhibitor of cysteine peptidase
MPDITLRAADNGRTIDVPEGTEVLIRLEENPTTGYRWTFDQDGDAAPPSGSDVASAPGAAVGAGGTRVFTVTARQPGDVHFKFKLRREWEGDSSIIQRYQVNIKVHT